MRKSSIYFTFALIIIGYSSALSAQTYYKGNGIYDIWMNQYNAPVITQLNVVGNVVVPWDNPGAQFQMTARSTLGNLWNPTQAGDCAGNRSTLTGVTSNWNSGIGISSSNGIQLRVDPLLYDETGTPPGNTCTAVQGSPTVAPMDFQFGVTLGDALSLPKEVIVVDMEMKREAGAQEIHPIQSELPAIFPSSYSLKWAYYSTDGVNFSPWYVGGTHNVEYWGNPDPAPTKNVKAIMLHTNSNALSQPNSGMGMAIYTNDTVTMVMSGRPGSTYQLGYMAATGSSNAGETITDLNWHKWRRIVVTGTLNDIINRIAISKAHLGSGTWRW